MKKVTSSFAVLANESVLEQICLSVLVLAW